MSSQDTMKYAEAEEQSAKILRDEINKGQAEIDVLQREASRDSSFQKDIGPKTQIVASLQEKEKWHDSQARKLRQQAMDEQRQEQQEEMRKLQQADHSIAKMAEREIKRSILF